MSDIQSILNDPCWFPYDLVDDYSVIEFVKTDANALRGAPFLDIRFAKDKPQRKRVSVADILPRLSGSLSAPPMIFHSAFCCSTLMAKALDAEGICLSLKEPNILMALANAKRMLRRAGRGDAGFVDLYQAVMRLLSRQFYPSEIVLLKLPNTANNLLEDAKIAGSPRLIMYASLEDFLISVLKKGEYCKTLIRTHYNIFSLDPCKLAEIAGRQAITLTDLQVAALIWRHQLELFERHKDGAKTMQDKVFLNAKRAVISETVKTLGLPHSCGQIDRVINGPVFSQDVKFENQIQNTSTKMAQAQIVRRRYQNDIESTLDWAKNLRLEGDVLPDVAIM